MAAARDLTPRSLLRRAGFFGVLAALLFVAMAMGGWAIFSLGGRTPVTAEALFVALLGALGLVFVLVAVGAFTAASRFPVIAHMAGPNDFLTFLAVALTGAGTVALLIMGSAGMVLPPLVALSSLLFISSAVRKVLRSPEARAPGEA